MARTWFYGKLLPAVLYARKENKGRFPPEERREAEQEWSLWRKQELSLVQVSILVLRKLDIEKMM
jgi:hypothetical protein